MTCHLSVPGSWPWPAPWPASASWRLRWSRPWTMAIPVITIVSVVCSYTGVWTGITRSGSRSFQSSVGFVSWSACTSWSGPMPFFMPGSAPRSRPTPVISFSASWSRWTMARHGFLKQKLKDRWSKMLVGNLMKVFGKHPIKSDAYLLYIMKGKHHHL